ncbi:hypothetical protein LBMAG49_30480 [Planctomycetota bacterium]|nr:hypothetical protein LBMAG49_30480 [Planctomycetota bacterium]
MQLTLEQRLLRFLEREEHGEARTHRELQAQPIDVREQEGQCIPAVRFVGTDGIRFRFRALENQSKFRTGDAVLVSDGTDLEGAMPMSYEHYDGARGELILLRDAYVRTRGEEFVVGAEYVLDRRSIGLRGRLTEVVRAAFENASLSALLAGDHVVLSDGARHKRAHDQLRTIGLNEAQLAAGAFAIATESLALVQGPPGTGKTRLLAEVVAALCRSGCRVGLTAFTNLAVSNALLAIRRVAPELPLFKVASNKNGFDSELREAGVQLVDPRRGRLPERGVVVAGTCFQIQKLAEQVRFHYSVFDEAGQLPIPHALACMLRSNRWLMFGDHLQLPPVVTAEHKDLLARASIFEYLHDRYGSQLLNTTYRMNDGVCRVVGDTFYGGRLQPTPEAAGRRMPFRPGGRLDDLLDPANSVVWMRIDHMQPGSSSPEEAAAVADVVADLVRQHGLLPADVAVIAPFRSQVRAVRSALQHKGIQGSELIVVDTVDRIQGQEREVVVISLATGDPDQTRSRNGAFHLSENRLNVAISRARTKVVLVASSHAFAALPSDALGLRAASKSRDLRDRLVAFDYTALYCAAKA